MKIPGTTELDTAKVETLAELPPMNYEITNQSQYEAAASFFKAIKDRKKKIVEFFEPAKKAAYAAHKAITTAEKSILKPIEEEITRCATAMLSFEGGETDDVHSRESWKAEVIDFEALVKAVAKGKVPLMALKADTTWLNKQATSLRDELKYPGVKSVKKESLVAR